MLKIFLIIITGILTSCFYFPFFTPLLPGGMNTKMIAAKIATSSNVDMIIANSKDLGVLHRILQGKNEGTLFVAHKDENFDLPLFVDGLHK